MSNEIKKDWEQNPRWKGIKRGYSAEDVARLRGEELYKLPGVGETIAWAQALLALDDADLESTLGVVLKVKEDIDHVRESGVLERA
jgi:isocitrate lyase